MMTDSRTMFTSAAALTLGLAIAAPAHAAGTAANTQITNTVTVNYKVADVAQTAAQASDSFVVDRKVAMTVTENGSSTTEVAPGRLAAVTAFVVRNISNAPLDLALAASQLAGGTAAHGGTDTFDVTNLRIFIDTDANGQYDDGVDTAVTHLDELAADAAADILVVADIPLGRATGDVAGIRLTATAHEAGGAGALGTLVTQTSGANTAGMDTVFADDLTPTGGNVASDGASFGSDDYTVAAAALTVEKTSRVISDPVSGTTDPKLIPGAVVEYCVAVYNAPGGAAATGIEVSDTLPAETDYLSAYGIRVNGTTSAATPGATCNEDGTSGGAFDAGTVTATLADVAAGASRTVRFRVTVR